MRKYPEECGLDSQARNKVFRASFAVRKMSDTRGLTILFWLLVVHRETLASDIAAALRERDDAIHERRQVKPSFIASSSR